MTNQEIDQSDVIRAACLARIVADMALRGDLDPDAIEALAEAQAAFLDRFAAGLDAGGRDRG